MRTGRMRNVVAAIAAAIGLTLFGPTLAAAAECRATLTHSGPVGSLVVDPTERPRLCSMQYHETLPLEDHEIVISSTTVLCYLDRRGCWKYTITNA
jgi:hypothetical protein